MRNKYLRLAIITMIQCTLLVIVVWLFIPLLLNQGEQLNQTQTFFKTHQRGFLLSHLFFYTAFYWLWPLLIHWMSEKQTLSTQQIKTAISARSYLLITMVLLELLIGWR